MPQSNPDPKINVWPWLAGAAVGGLGWLVYGALVEANKLVLERHSLHLPRWPKERNGYRIALLADLHIRDKYSIAMAHRAIEMALEESPDMVVIAGDFVGYWKLETPWLLEEALRPLAPMAGRILGVPGNHDYWSGDAGLLRPIGEELGFQILRNEIVEIDGIIWAGVDSVNEGYADPFATMIAALRRQNETEEPIVTLWHEPDQVGILPSGSALMLSGHSHGGQWRFPWGWRPMGTKNGSRYVEGFYPDTATPLYVSRGIGTTGPPARLGALAEVTILDLYSSTGPEGF